MRRKTSADENDEFDCKLYRMLTWAERLSERDDRWLEVRRHLAAARSCTYTMLTTKQKAALETPFVVPEGEPEF